MEAATLVRSPLTASFVPSVGAISLVSTPRGFRLSRRGCGSLRMKKLSLTSHSVPPAGTPGSCRRLIVKASSSSDSEGSAVKSATPTSSLQPLTSSLSSCRLTEMQRKNRIPSVTGTELVLYRRIAELKANERRRALEEILYALVVQKFMDANISLIPSLTSSSSDLGRLDTWPNQGAKIAQIYSPEMKEMINNHIIFILGKRGEDPSEVSKLRLGQAYAASIMYGYLLKRVDERFQLEKAIRKLPGKKGRKGDVTDSLVGDSIGNNSLKSAQTPHPEILSADEASYISFGEDVFTPSRLTNYLRSFDAETLRRYATIRSTEAVSIVEKHTEALFGSPKGTNEDGIKISSTGLKKLVLEAITFGAFLWDVESYVDSRYNFVTN
ncbi:UV-B-induced protein, chloroplastic-like protein [Drosera capensis]